MRTIRVTGKGMLKVRPDMTRIVITLEGTNMDYGDTLKESAWDTEQLKDTLEPFGFEREELKTLSFSVDTEYESYKVKDEYKRRFAGYKFTHVLKLEGAVRAGKLPASAGVPPGVHSEGSGSGEERTPRESRAGRGRQGGGAQRRGRAQAGSNPGRGLFLG